MRTLIFSKSFLTMLLFCATILLNGCQEDDIAPNNPTTQTETDYSNRELRGPKWWEAIKRWFKGQNQPLQPGQQPGIKIGLSSIEVDPETGDTINIPSNSILAYVGVQPSASDTTIMRIFLDESNSLSSGDSLYIYEDFELAEADADSLGFASVTVLTGTYPYLFHPTRYPNGQVDVDVITVDAE